MLFHKKETKRTGIQAEKEQIYFPLARTRTKAGSWVNEKHSRLRMIMLAMLVCSLAVTEFPKLSGLLNRYLLSQF